MLFEEFGYVCIDRDLNVTNSSLVTPETEFNIPNSMLYSGETPQRWSPNCLI